MPVDKGTKRLLVALISFPFCGKHKWYGFRCGIVSSLNCHTISNDTSFPKLPLSMISKHILPSEVHLVWKTFYLNQFSSSTVWDTFKLHWTTIDIHWSTKVISSSTLSTFGFSLASLPSSPTYSSTSATTVPFGQFEATCLKPRHLKPF